MCYTGERRECRRPRQSTGRTSGRQRARQLLAAGIWWYLDDGFSGKSCEIKNLNMSEPKSCCKSNGNRIWWNLDMLQPSETICNPGVTSFTSLVTWHVTAMALGRRTKKKRPRQTLSPRLFGRSFFFFLKGFRQLVSVCVSLCQLVSVAFPRFLRNWYESRLRRLLHWQPDPRCMVDDGELFTGNEWTWMNIAVINKYR